jgi:hypothetical protein
MIRKLLEYFQQWGRKEKGPPTPLELRDAVLEAILAALQPHRKARGPIPINRIEIWCCVADPNLRQLYEQALFHELPPLSEDLATHLRERGWLLMEGWTCVARMTEAFEPGWNVPPGQPLYVLALRSTPEAVPALPQATPQQGTSPEPSPPPEHLPTAQASLSVLAGKARKTKYRLDPQIPMTIGRGDEHRLSNGALRRNLMVFLDPDHHPELTEAQQHSNKRVGRIHATIQFEPKNNAWRLVRDGDNPLIRYRGERRLEVSAHPHQVVYLQDGDLIELGTGGARLRFSLLSSKVQP